MKSKYYGSVPVTDPEILAHYNDPVEAALSILSDYGQTDGAHHKQWVIDQVARVLNGAPVSVNVRLWNNSTQVNTKVGTSEQYEKWVAEVRDGEDGPDTYEYSEGIAP